MLFRSRKLRPEIAPEIEEIVLHALERDRNERFESAYEMREALAHPASVRLTNRAARVRPPSPMPSWLKVSLTVCGGVAAYIFLIWAFSAVGTLIPRTSTSNKAPSIVSGR